MTLPVLPSIDLAAVAIGVVAFVVLFRLRWGIFRTLGLSALLGIVYWL